MWLSQFKLVPALVLVAAALAVAVAIRPDPVRAGNPDDAKKPADKPAVKADGKEKKELGQTVRGTVTATDAARNTITLAVLVSPDRKDTVEKTYPMAADGKVILVNSFTKTNTPQEGKVSDLMVGTHVNARLTADNKAVAEAVAMAPGLHARVKFADAANKTIGLEYKGNDGPEETTLKLADDVKVVMNDGLDKMTGDKEGKLSDLTEGTSVHIHQSVDRKMAIQIRVLGDVVHCSLKSLDSGNGTVTVIVKEDGQLVEKTYKLAKGARVDGNPTENSGVDLTLSVFDKSVAVAVRARD